eukprot:TRINITY_DN19793_c0_g2_i5.p1 TRINITY_DN19793_c0_g2~~TRINITY_DN19793_c0_g2_i5.p1  ORF type:complete len:648 (-),score=95.99 TRINITY_DN19793_c0_g2_i5:221-2164(-)
MFPPPLSKPTDSRAHEDQFVVPKQVESCFASEADLKGFLEGHDIDTEQFGKGSAKSLAFLLLELRTGTCCFQSQHGQDQGRDPPRRLLRIVEPVFARLCCRNLLLVRVSQRFPDGRERKRKMLLAEKKGPRDGGGVLATLLRGMNEELGIPLDDIHRDGVLQYRSDTYHFELEEIDSPSYPGLLSSYRTHHVQIDLLDAGIELFQKCGFPVPPANPSTDSSSLAFETKETNRLGTTLHRWQWYTVADALRDGVVKFPPMALSSSSVLPRSKHDPGAEGQNNARKLTRDDIPDVSTLINLLIRAGIDPMLYGVEKSKPVSALLREVHSGESVLEFDESSRSLRRIAEPVFVQLRLGDRVLVEVEQTLADGRTRKRNIVLAEKKSPEDENVQATVLRGLREELSLPTEFPLESAVRFVPEAYCCVAENLESSSYPGLTCLYVTHYCTAKVSEAGVESFSRGGFLADEFETVEDGKLCRWKWTDLNAARRDKVKGLPNLKEQEVGNSERAVYEKLLTVPLDVVGLRVLLEVGGVNVSSWGEHGAVALKSLAKELESGASCLERDQSNGRIRRVVKSSSVRVKVSPGQSTQSGCGTIMETDADLVEGEGTSSMCFENAKDLAQLRADSEYVEMLHVDVTSYPGLPACCEDC